MALRSHKKEFAIEQYINRLARMSTRWLDPRLAELGLAGAQLPVFGALKVHGSLTQKELASLLHVEQPSMAQLLARMDRDGLISRKPDARDGRSSQVSLTRKALRLGNAAYAALHAGKTVLQKDIDEDDLRTVERVLAKMLENMEEALRTDMPSS